MTYDHKAKKESDKVFLDNIKFISKCLRVDPQDITTSSPHYDREHAIDFICNDLAINFKTCYNGYKTFTFRIPPNRYYNTEFDKCIYIQYNTHFDVIMIVANVELNKLYWTKFEDIYKIKNNCLIKPVTRGGISEGTSLKAFEYEEIEKAGGKVYSHDIDLSRYREAQ